MNNHSYDKAFYCQVSVGLGALNLNLLHNSANSQSLSITFLNIMELFLIRLPRSYGTSHCYDATVYSQ